jgi:glutamate racemase
VERSPRESRLFAGRDPREGGLMQTTVGIFDSGVGGLTVAAAVHELMAAQPVRYIADTAFFPYGERAPEEVEARSAALTAQLVGEGCGLVVVACNTASSAALERLRAQFPATPIVGMEPPLKPAAERTRSGRVAVLVTPATARGERLARLQAAYAGGAEVEVVPMPGLADLVEAGEIGGERVEQALRRALDGLIADQLTAVDEVALGCTHYGFLRATLEAMLGDGVEVIDAADAVARRVRHQLEAHGFEVPTGAVGAVHARATGDQLAFETAVERLRDAGAVLPPITFASETPNEAPVRSNA